MSVAATPRGVERAHDLEQRRAGPHRNGDDQRRRGSLAAGPSANAASASPRPCRSAGRRPQRRSARRRSAPSASRVSRPRRHGRGRARRCRRRAGRPPRGTASSGAASCRRGRARAAAPTARCGCAGRARSSARRGRAPAGSRRGVAARSRRRRMPPEKVLTSRSASSARLEPLEQLAGAARARRPSAGGSRRPTSSRFARAVSSPSTVADWPARPIGRGRRAGRRRRRCPATRGAARRRLGERREDADGGRLARAVVAEQAEDATRRGR